MKLLQNYQKNNCWNLLGLTQSENIMKFYYKNFTGLCNRRGSKTLETAHPEKPTPSGFRAKNYKIRLG